MNKWINEVNISSYGEPKNERMSEWVVTAWASDCMGDWVSDWVSE